jgi:hypothetical protein
MPRPVVGLSTRSFQKDVVNDFYLSGFDLKQNGDVPVARMRSTLHYWKNVEVVDDATSTDTKLHLRGKPKRKNGAFAAAPPPGAAPAPGYDGYDDLTITLTWDEGTGDETTETFIYDDIEYTP